MRKKSNQYFIKSLAFIIIIFIFSSNSHYTNAVGLSTIPHLNLAGDQDAELFGYPVRFIGDVDNDGYDDVAIGSILYDVNGVEDVGRVSIYSGQDIGGDGVPDLIRTHTQPFTNTASPSAFFGSALAGIGDANGDGFDDYIIMDPRFSTGEGGWIANEFGRVIAYSGQDGSILWIYVGNTFAQFQFGNATIVSSRDFSGDGRRDVAVGAPGIDISGAGAILILDATNGSLLTQYNGTENFESVGKVFDTGYDIDGDSVEDFIIGEPFASGRRGAIRVISGVDLESPTTIYTQSGPDQRFAFFGLYVQLLADTNNDGRADFTASSREDVGGLRRAGKIKIFSGLDNSLLQQYDGIEQTELFGASLTDTGDLNNDGYGDVAAAGLNSSNGAGKADIFQNKGGIKWEKVPGGSAGEGLGSDIDGGGDANNDGLPDLILGSIGGQKGAIFPGRARVVASDPTHVPEGSNIEVHPEIGKQGTSVTFLTVSIEGNVALTYAPATGANFRTKAGGTTEEWSISTDATTSDSITVCLEYNETLYSDESKINIQHVEGPFRTVTTSLNTVSNIVCGSVESL